MSDFRALEGNITWVEINLDEVQFNVQSIKNHIGPHVKLIAVVKANGYGHGAVQVGRACLEAGAEMLAVHRLSEGVELRQAGIHKPILILGYIPPNGYPMVAEMGLSISPICIEDVRLLSSVAIKYEKEIPIHIKVDTGMNRYGLYSHEVLPFLEEASHLPGIQIDGIYSHFATADWKDQTILNRQIKLFKTVLSNLQHAGYSFRYIHMANSAATMICQEAHFNAVRTGIAVYGLDPSSDWPSTLEIHPALSLKSRVIRLHELPAGEGISYGHTFVTQHPTLAALIPIGYGDGYHRHISNQGCVLLHGQRASILGRICMDQLVVDGTQISGLAVGDEAVLIGRQGDGVIRAEEIAQWAGTINYEVTTSLLPRVLRKYIKNGQIFDTDAV